MSNPKIFLSHQSLGKLNLLVILLFTTTSLLFTLAHRANSLEAAQKQLRKLIQWSKNNGAFVSDKINFKVYCYGGEFSSNVIAAKPIKSGDIVLKIPNSLFNTFRGESSYIWSFVKQRNDTYFTYIMRQQPQVMMALDLLIEEEAEARNPYIDFLPKLVYGALDWTNETAQLSSHFNIWEKLMNRNRTLENLYSLIVDNVIDAQNIEKSQALDIFSRKFTLANFRRAWVTVTTRSHGVLAINQSITARRRVVLNASMVPLADLFQHSSEEGICRGTFQGYDMTDSDGNPAFTVVASKDFSVGETFSVCYGHLPNANLLLNYGFAVENNRFDRLQISSSMRSPLKKMRDLLIRELNLPLEVSLNANTSMSMTQKLALKIGQLSLNDLRELQERKKDFFVKQIIREEEKETNHENAKKAQKAFMTDDSLNPFGTSNDTRNVTHRKILVRKLVDDVISPYVNKRISEGLVYSSIVAQTSIFERFRENENDKADLRKYQQQASNANACLTDQISNKEKLTAKYSALNASALILKISRQNLAAKLGDVYLLKFFEFENYTCNPNLSGMNKTILKNLIYDTALAGVNNEDIKNNKMKEKKGHMFIEAIRGMIYDKDGNLDQPKHDMKEAHDNILPNSARYVHNFDGTVTVLWHSSNGDQKSRVVRNIQEATQFVNSYNHAKKPKQRVINRIYNPNYSGNYPSHYYYNSQFYSTSFWPVHNSHYYGNYGNIYNHQSVPTFQNENSNLGQKQRLASGDNSLKNGATAQESISAGIKLAGQTVDEATRDALDGIVKKVFENFKLYDENKKPPDGVRKEDMAEIERTLSRGDFSRKFTNKFLSHFEDGLKDVLERKIFDVVQERFYVPSRELGD